jgi:hypothetical protein
VAGETDGKEEKTKTTSQRKKEKNKEMRADVIQRLGMTVKDYKKIP